jgi:hypothetical protein
MLEWLLNTILPGIMGALSGWGAISYKMGKYIEKIEKLEKEVFLIGDIRERLAKVETGKADINTYIQSKSPLALTDKGKAVLLDSKGKDFIEDNKKVLLEKIHLHNPKTAYDVQTYSEEVIKEQSNLEGFNPIKNYAFKEGIELGIIIKIMGIFLRDLALPENGFNIN